MVRGFVHEDPVLDFGPRRPKEHGKSISWEYLLWPAWAYRVVAPLTRSRRLNAFQRAIIGLCKAGLYGSEEIAERLAVHPDLAAFILVELTDLGYIDIHGVPTDRGASVLAEDDDDGQELVAGFVFQDPWSGELWPRFVEELNYCELEYDDSGFPRVLRGTTGKRRRQGAFMVLPSDILSPSPPTPKAVVRAVAGQGRALRQVDHLAELDDDCDDGGLDLSSLSLNRVSFIEEEASPVFLMTYLYLADDVAESGDWYACDPFGMGTSIRLRRRIEHVMQASPPLYNVVDRLVGRGVHEGIEEQRVWVDWLRAKAALAVERRLTVNVRAEPVFGELVDMEFSRQQALALGKDCGGTQLRGALRSCLKSLEALFAGLAHSHPLGDVWKRVYVKKTDRRTGRKWLEQQRDKGLNRAVFLGAAKMVGFGSSVPESLLHVTPGQIRSVSERGEHWRLRPLVMATILAAQEDTAHPLRSTAVSSPALLQSIDEVAEVGAAAGHAGSGESNFELLERIVQTTYEIVAALIGFSPVSVACADRTDGAEHGEG